MILIKKNIIYFSKNKKTFQHKKNFYLYYIYISLSFNLIIYPKLLRFYAKKLNLIL
jgi:hypothetical protein